MCVCVFARISHLHRTQRAVDRMNRPLTVHECRTLTLTQSHSHKHYHYIVATHSNCHSICERIPFTNITHSHVHTLHVYHYKCMNTIFRSMGENDDANNFVNILLEPNKCQCSFSIGALEQVPFSFSFSHSFTHLFLFVRLFVSIFGINFRSFYSKLVIAIF